jgi:Kef-type K+ transport system membrane component KefB
MLHAFAQDVRSGRAGLIRAARRAYLLAVLALALPAAVLGGLLLLTRPAPVPLPALLVLGGLALALALGALTLARNAAGRTDQPARQAALTGAIQAATVPGVPLLLACATLSQGEAVLLFLGLAAALHLWVWARLPGWVREPEAPVPDDV